MVQAPERPGTGIQAQVRRLRDLTADEFRDVYGCDRFTATIMANRFRHIVSHMCNQLRIRSFSPILRDVADLCGTLSGPDGLGFPMVAVSETLPLFYGSVPDAVPLVLHEYGLDRLHPGDSLLVNDYYRAGTHLNDVCQIRPMFYKGEQIGAVTIRAHMTDMGGLVMGGWETAKANVFHDGLRLPPMLLYDAGRPVASTVKLLYANTRLPDLIVPDLETMYHSLELGEQLLVETIDKYGFEAYTGAVRYACDAAAEQMAQALRTIPDGVYEGEEWLDGDGRPDSPEYVVRVRITKVGERAEFDFRNSSRATRGALNSAWPDIKTAVATALKFLVDQKSSVTSGTLRNVDCVVPPDAIFNPFPPHACMFYSTVVRVMTWAVMKALNPALGAGAVASCGEGVRTNTEAFAPDGSAMPISQNTGGGSSPWGATQHADADSGQQVFNANMLHEGGIEAAERVNPYVVLRAEYVPDSAGPGVNRGGASTIKDDMWLVPTRHRFQTLAQKRPQAGGGVYGGGAGALGAAWLFDGAVTEHGRRPPFWPGVLHHEAYRLATPAGGKVDPVTREHDPHTDNYISLGDMQSASAGAIQRMLSYSGGGWGDPLERDPARVCRDVRDEYVSVEGAARDYGVVVSGDPVADPEGLSVDLPATESLRARLRAERRPAASPHRASPG